MPFSLQMMAKLARRLNRSNINVILSQSASWANLTSALKTLQVSRAMPYAMTTPRLCSLGEESSHRFRSLRHVPARAILLSSLPNVHQGIA